MTSLSRDLGRAPASLLLFPAPAVTAPLLWRSSYVCQPEEEPGGGLFGFVRAVAPAAETLLVKAIEPSDQSTAAHLDWLGSACGESVAVTEVANRFDLEALISPDWPDQLPVLCPEPLPAR
ncbi:hypothetical protein [Synechococcus sp. RSCCF101]|uniref:hypothetical protein n=1 Tax=Synechococcus sp. RSCCF101 TaxID=2511069 RepID=UPI00177CBB00|nr:hypothetical protein [Synechococcus sp. RSCCF101]